MDVKKIDDWLKYGPAQFEIISTSGDLIRKVLRIKDGVTFRLGFTLKHNTFIMDSGVRRIEITYINRFEKDCVHVVIKHSVAQNFKIIKENEETVEINRL